MKTFKSKVEAEFNPDAIDIAEAFWEMNAEEQCYFFEHLYHISGGGSLSQQMQGVIDDDAFSHEAKMCLLVIGDYAK